MHYPIAALPLLGNGVPLRSSALGNAVMEDKAFCESWTVVRQTRDMCAEKADPCLENVSIPGTTNVPLLHDGRGPR